MKKSPAAWKTARRTSGLFLSFVLALVIALTGILPAHAGPLLQTGETPVASATASPGPETPEATFTPAPTGETSPTPELSPTPEASPTAEPPAPTPEPTLKPPKTDDEAITRTLFSAIGEQRETALAYMLYKTQVERIQYDKSRKLALVWLQFADPQTGKVIATEPGIAIARKIAKLKWQITLQVDGDWTTQLKKVPVSMLSTEMRAELTPHQEVSAQASAPLTGYKLPWQGGTYNSLSGSIGHVFTYKSCPTTCLYAFDFADGSMFHVYAAKAGRVKYAVWSYPNNQHDNTNYLILEDASTTPTSYMVYYHLAQNSIPPELRQAGAPVNQGQYIADADNTGYSTGSHLHFHVHMTPNSVWGNSVDIVFDDVPINGGRPRMCSEAAGWPQYGKECNKNDGPYLSGNTTGPLPPAPNALGPTGKVRTSYPTFTWSAIDGAQQYYLYLNKVGATTATFSTLINANVCQDGICSYKPTSIIPDANYEFKVRAGTSTGWSQFSAVDPFTVYTLPDVPVLVSPSGTIYYNNPAYTWKAAEGATQYYLMVYSNVSSSYVIYRTLQAVNVCHDDGTCSYTSTLNTKHGGYKFKVRAGNATGQWSAYSPNMEFFSYLAPFAPKTTAPTAGTKFTIPRPKYAWNASAGATKYGLVIYSLTKKANVASYTLASTNVCTGDSCWFIPSINLTGADYQFHVRAYNDNGWGDYSPWVPFNVQLVPDVPQTVSPVGAISTNSPAYTWKPVPGAVSYYLMVWDNTAAGWIIYRTLYPSDRCHEDGTCCYVSTALTEPGHSYKWKVRASNAYGWSPYSPWVEFNMP